MDLPECLHVAGRLYRRRSQAITALQWTTRSAGSLLIIIIIIIISNLYSAYYKKEHRCYNKKKFKKKHYIKKITIKPNNWAKRDKLA